MVHTSAPFSKEEANPISDTMSLLTFREVRGGMLGVWEARRFVSGVLIRGGHCVGLGRAVQWYLEEVLLQSCMVMCNF